MRSLPARLLIAVLLASVAVGVVGGVTGPPTVAEAAQSDGNVSDRPSSLAQPANTTSYLRVPDDRLTRTSYAHPGVDVPGALATDRDRLRTSLVADSFEAEFENASSTAARTAAVTRAARQYERMITAAQQRQRDAISEYSTGKRTTQGLARSLARASETASAVVDGVENISDVANEPLDYGIGGGLETRFANMDPGLVTLDGELRSRFNEWVTGTRQADGAVYVEAGDSDLVLATVLNDNYLRESYIGEEYDQVFASELETTELAQRLRIGNLYNWGLDDPNTVVAPRLERIGNISVWEAESIHRQGRFVIHFDANTNNVFKEEQTKRISDVRPLTRHTRTNGSLRLVVNETHDTGPTEVRLFDNVTGQPRNGTVYVGEMPVGTTGDDGRLWTIDSHGSTRIEARTADGSVSLFLFDAEE